MHHQTIHRRNILTFLRAFLELCSNIYAIIQRILNEFSEKVSMDNIETKLWNVSDTLTNCQVLIENVQLE